MDKRQALTILIDNSFVLTGITKEKLLGMISRMSDEEIDEWGKLFATEQNFVSENKEAILNRINSL